MQHFTYYLIIKIILLNYIGNYHCIDHSNATLFRLFEVPKEKEDLIINADSAVQSYWTHIHNNSNHAPPLFKGFNYKSTEAMPPPPPQEALPPPPSSLETSPLPPSLPEASLENTLPFSQHFGIFRNNNKLVYQSQDYMCKNKAGKVGKEYFNHSWYVINLICLNCGLNLYNVNSLDLVDRLFTLMLFNTFILTIVVLTRCYMISISLLITLRK